MGVAGGGAKRYSRIHSIFQTYLTYPHPKEHHITIQQNNKNTRHTILPRNPAPRMGAPFQRSPQERSSGAVCLGSRALHSEAAA